MIPNPKSNPEEVRIAPKTSFRMILVHAHRSVETPINAEYRL